MWSFWDRRHTQSRKFVLLLFFYNYRSIFSQELFICFFWKRFKLAHWLNLKCSFFLGTGEKTTCLLTNSIFSKKWGKINLPRKKKGYLCLDQADEYKFQYVIRTSTPPPQRVCSDINCEFKSSLMNYSLTSSFFGVNVQMWRRYCIDINISL